MADKLKIIVCACCFQHQQALAAQQQVCTAPVSSAVLFFPGTMRKENHFLKGYSFSPPHNFYSYSILLYPKSGSSNNTIETGF